MSKKIIALAMFSFLVLVLAGCSGKSGNQNDKKSDENAKGTPPAEMTEACSGKSEGDSCEVTMQGDDAKKITGTCKKMSEGSDLACLSENGLGGQGGPGGQNGQGGPNGQAKPNSKQ